MYMRRYVRTACIRIASNSECHCITMDNSELFMDILVLLQCTILTAVRCWPVIYFTKPYTFLVFCLELVLTGPVLSSSLSLRVLLMSILFVFITVCVFTAFTVYVLWAWKHFFNCNIVYVHMQRMSNKIYTVVEQRVPYNMVFLVTLFTCVFVYVVQDHKTRCCTSWHLCV